MSPPILSPTRGEFDDLRSGPGSEVGSEGVSPRMRTVSITGVIQAATNQEQSAKEEQAALNALWKQVMDPVLDYCTVRTPRISFFLALVLIAHDIDFCQQCHRSPSSCHPASRNNSSDGGHRLRGAEERLRPARDLYLHSTPEDVARVPEADGGACRRPQEVCRRRVCRVLPPERNKRCRRVQRKYTSCSRQLTPSLRAIHVTGEISVRHDVC